MKHILKKLSNHLVDLELTVSLAKNIVNNEKATDLRKNYAKGVLETTNANIKETENVIKLLSLEGINDIYPQNKEWDNVQKIIEDSPRNSIGTAVAYLSEKYILIKK